MAYDPGLEEIRQMLAGMKSHGEVLAAGPVSGIPQYPNPEVGDKYLNTNDNVFQECRVPRRWTGGYYQSSRIGSVYTLRSTGMAFIRAPSGWQPYEQFLAALGQNLGAGGGAFTVADITALKTFGAPQPSGHVVSVISVDFPGFPPGIPTIYQWKADYDSSHFGGQDDGFPNVVVPNSVWAGGKIGAWINILALTPSPYVGPDPLLLYPMPLDTNPPPPEHPEDNPFFLTGPGHASPFLAGYWDNGAGQWYIYGPGLESVYESGQQSFTWVRRTDPNAWALQADILFLNGIYRNSGEIGGAGLTSVYVVHDGADGDWAGHEGEFAWLDGDGATWLFDGGAGYEDQPAGIVNFLLQVQVEIHLGKILIPYVRNVNVNEWIPQIAGLSIILPGPLVGPSTEPLVLIGGLRNNPLQGNYGEQVVEIYITTGGDLDSMAVTQGTRIAGDTGGGADKNWIKLLADGNGDFHLEFAKAAGGVFAGVILIGGVSYALDLDFDVP